VAEDVQSGICFAIGQGMLPWQPILGAKSAEIGDTPSFLGFAFHNGRQDGKADGRINTPDVLSTSRKNLVNKRFPAVEPGMEKARRPNLLQQCRGTFN